MKGIPPCGSKVVETASLKSGGRSNPSRVSPGSVNVVSAVGQLSRDGQAAPRGKCRRTPAHEAVPLKPKPSFLKETPGSVCSECSLVRWDSEASDLESQTDGIIN